MSRPGPHVFLERIVSDTVLEQICSSQEGSVYAVLYRGMPITLRRQRTDRNEGLWKYRRTSWSNAGHAHRLCLALNRIWKTDAFTVSTLKP